MSTEPIHPPPTLRQTSKVLVPPPRSLRTLLVPTRKVGEREPPVLLLVPSLVTEVVPPKVVMVLLSPPRRVHVLLRVVRVVGSTTLLFPDENVLRSPLVLVYPLRPVQ